MINKAHILTIAILLVLYGLVAVWKYQDSIELQPNAKIDSGLKNTLDSRLFWERYSRASEFRSNGDFSKAATMYDEAIMLNGKHKDALYYAGSMHLLSGNFERAGQYWETLLELEPNAPRTHLQLGTLFFCMDRRNSFFHLDRAKQQISDAWDLNREETGAPLLLAKILLLGGDTKEAAQILNDVLATDPSNSEAMFLSGFTNWIQGETDRARQLHIRAGQAYQKQNSGVLTGEGNTETGARAMLSEGRFCDKFESFIQNILNQDSTSPEHSFQLFSDSLGSWKSRFTH